MAAVDPLFIKSIMIHWDKVPKDSYVRRIRSLKGLECLSFQSPVTFFVGENGSGKSTLLEAMAVSYGFNPEGGTMNEGSQFFIVTHSPILLGLPGAQILAFDKGQIRPCEYEETDSYRITKSFVNNREGMLKIILED